MSNQLQITGGAKVRDLNDVIIGTNGVLSSLAFNVANGVPKLDSNGKILVSQLPNSVMEYLGTWNAATNTPYLVNGVGNAGDVYLVSVAGTHDFGAGPITFAVSDQVIYSGSIWQKASGASGTVTSVGLSTSGTAFTIGSSPVTTSGTITINGAGTASQYINGAGNLTTFPTLITSIGLSMPSAFSVSNSPLTANGTISVTGAGTVSQYIDGTGALQSFPSLTGYVPYVGATTDVDLGVHVLNAQALHVKGTAGAGHLGLKHQTATPSGSANESLVFANVDGDLGWQNGNLYSTILNTHSNTANRVYTFPNASGTLALTSDINYPVTSVFGRTGAVTAQSGDYTTTLVTEGTNLYYTDARARGALSFTAGSGAYNSTTGVITIPTNNNQITNGANYITLTSLSATTPLSYNNTTGAFSISQASTTVSGYLSSTDFTTFSNKQSAITLTTTGSSGSSTFISNTLNVPTYTLSGLGGQPLATNLTSLSGLTYVSASFVKMTAAGTFTLDTNTYYLASNPNSYISLTALSASSPLSYNNTTGAFTISQATTSTNGYLSSTDWNTFNNKQGAITLTTTGTSGAATFVGNTLNIPQYQSALTNPVTGTGTANYITKFTGTSTIGNSLIQDNGTNLSVNVAPFSGAAFYVKGLGATSSTYSLYTLNTASTTTFYVNDAGYSYIASGLGIGTSPTNLYLLELGGSARITGQLNLGSTITNGTYTYTLPSATGTFALTSDLSSYVPTSRTLTINGTAYDLSANRSWSVGTVTSVAALTIGTTGTDITSSVATGTTTPVITLNVPTASATNRGALSSADWTTFNNKQNALTNPVTGTGTSGQVTYFNGTTTVTGSSNHFWDATNNRLGINTSSPSAAVTSYSTTQSNQFKAAGTAPGITFSDSVSSVTYGAAVGVATAANNFITGAAAGDMAITNQSFTAGAILFGIGTTEKMRLTSTGSLGIGTSSPSQQLDVSGGARFFSAGNWMQFTTNVLTSLNSDGAHIRSVISTAANPTYTFAGNTNLGMFQAATDILGFTTSGTERMRITSGGNVLIGTTSQINSCFTCIAADLSPYNGLVIKNTNSGNSGTLILFSNSAGSTAGYIQHTGSTTVSYVTTSDYRLKENIKLIDNGLQNILNLKPVTYNWKNTNNEQGEGFIAHELQEYIPLAVTGVKDDINEDGSIKPQGVDYSKIVPYLVKAIQEQNQLIQELSAKVTALENK